MEGKMTNDDWKYVDEKLKQFYSPVKLKCDQYELILKLEMISQFKNAIVFYADGVFKGKWLLKECEERARFCRKGERSVWSRKQKQEFKKLGKRFLNKRDMDPDAKFSFYSNTWNSFNALKRHLIKNNSKIDLLKGDMK